MSLSIDQHEHISSILNQVFGWVCNSWIVTEQGDFISTTAEEVTYSDLERLNETLRDEGFRLLSVRAKHYPTGDAVLVGVEQY